MTVIGVNFLPWRKKVSERAKKKYLLILSGTLFLGVCVVYILNLLTGRPVHQEQQGNAFLEQAVKTVNDKLAASNPVEEQYKTLLARLTYVQEIEMRNQKVSRLLVEIARVIPKGAYLTKLELDQDRLNLYGRAVSNLEVNQLFKNILDSKILTEPLLNKMNSEKEGISFQMGMTLSKR